MINQMIGSYWVPICPTIRPPSHHDLISNNNTIIIIIIICLKLSKKNTDELSRLPDYISV